MQPTTTVTLKTVFSDVLANLAFMFTDDTDATPPAGSGWLETTIGYHGPATGMLRFHCTRDFAVALAANLLGASPEDEDCVQQSQDAIGEFMNIVCGQFITATHGTEQVFDLTIPCTRDLPAPPEFITNDDASALALNVEGQRIELIYVADAVPACP